MIRLSFSTLGCPDWSLARVVDTAGRAGYDGVELRFLEGEDTLWERPELRGGGLRETRTRLADAGLTVPCVDSRSFFHHRDEATRRRAAEEALRTVELASALGAPGIRVFGDRVQPGADLASTRGWIAESLAAVREGARRSGVAVWLETHGDFATAEAARSVLELAGGEGLGVLWDPANAFCEFGEDPEEAGPRLRGAIQHVHLKDARRPAAPATPGSAFTPWTPTLAGDGDVPAARTLAWLQRSGYDGWVSFEWEKRWHPEIAEPEVALPHFARWAAGELRGRVDPEPEAARLVPCGRMRVEVHSDRAALGRGAARAVASEIRALVARDGRAAVIFASAPSQNEFLAALRETPGIDWRRVTAFHLDEYVGMRPSHPASFRRFLTDRLFDHVPVRAFHGLDGEAPDLATECARYAGRLREASPGLAILGIGENGHLAFIDPPLCDFFEPRDVRVVELDEACRRQQVNDGAFARLEDVPRRALSLTVPFILGVPRAVAIVPGPAKRRAIEAAVLGPVTTACPASILRRHRDATLFVDEDSAGGIPHPRQEMK
jgi:glucosamine-6-phosphate deaminase